MSTPSHTDRVNAVLACLRGETSHEAVAERYGVSLIEVQRWEDSFIAGGSSALDSSDRDLVTEMGAINAVSQSLVAILDLDELWNAAVDNLYWVFNYIACVALIEGDMVVIKSAYALNGTRIENHVTALPLHTEDNALSWVAAHGRPLNISDTHLDSIYKWDSAIGPMRSELAMPIIFKGTVLGVLDVKSADAYHFDQRDVSILETIAVQLAVAIENAQLFDMVRRRISQLELVRNITTRAIENLDVQSVLNHTVQATREIIGYPAIMIGMLSADSVLTLTTVNSSDRKLVAAQTQALRLDGTRLIDTVILTGRLTVNNDIRPDTMPRPILPTSRSALVVPIRSRGDLIGVIAIENDRANAFDDADVATVTILADQLTITIRGAALFQQTQAQLREISLFRRLADEANVGILTHNENGQIDFANPAAARLFGYSEPSLLQHINADNLFPDAVRTAIMANTLSGWHDEIALQRLNGQTFAVDISSFPIHAPDGTFVSFGAVLSDATERRRLLDEQQQTNARFTAILEATDEAIVAWDDTWRVVLANPAAAHLLGVPVSEMIGSTRHAWANHPRLRLVINSAENERIEFPEQRVGRVRHLRWQSENASGYMTVIYDITNQVGLEQAREEMTNMLIHDLRGPITSVVGGIELAQSLLEEESGDGTALRFLRLSARSSAMLLDMAESLLDVAKFESGHMTLQTEPINVLSLFDTVLGMFVASAQSANVRLESSCGDTLPIINGDRKLLRRTLSNLLDNALKFTPDGGKILLRVEAESDTGLRFSVLDTGKGIPEAYRERIFEKYAQIPRNEGRRRGTGLGLAFCRLVAEAHHGRIWVENAPEGGSAFIFTIFDTATSPQEMA
jgi:PAS domain S-box-containing protein